MKTANSETMVHVKRKLHSIYCLYQKMAFEFQPTRGMWMAQ